VEKIQKALEKAREQRGEVLGTRPSRPKERSPGRAAARDVNAPIAYRETRVSKAESHVLRQNRVIAGAPREHLADAFRILRTQVLQRLSAKKHSTLAITSPNPEEGKSLTSVNLAISLAMDVNHTVLLVDLDLRRPSVHDFFNFKPEVSLADYLNGKAPLSDCLVNPGIERLVVLPAAKRVGNSSELLSSPEMVALARELKTRYPDRLVVYDLPPLLATDDSLVFLQYVDACLLVIEEGETNKEDIRKSIELLKGCNLIGTVLNKSKNHEKTYYY
jgi:exopolysaccharide/PEP-CTERM locus tyrosine autokinase